MTNAISAAKNPNIIPMTIENISIARKILTFQTDIGINAN
jgi:hypothetical protein